MKESFNDLYTRLYRENFEELEALRKKEKNGIIKMLFVFLIIFGLCAMFPAFAILFIAIAVVIIINSLRINSKANSMTNNNGQSYKQVFKEKIVKPMIENCFDNARYTPEEGISSYEYLKGGYNESHDRYNSEDLVLASFATEESEAVVIKFAEVHTERESKDEDGNRTYSTVFHGLAGNFLLPKDIQSQIYIRSNWRVWGIGKNSNKVKMDMPEFEKLFDVESKDAIMAMRVLTADIMAEMIDLYNKYKYQFEISILNDTVHMRLRTGEVFEPDVFKSSLEFKTLEKYYLVLTALINIAKHIHDTIAKIEV